MRKKNIGQPAYIVRGVYSTKRIPAFITDPNVNSVDVSADINADANNTDTALTAASATGDDVYVEVDDGVPELDVYFMTKSNWLPQEGIERQGPTPRRALNDEPAHVSFSAAVSGGG